MKQVYPQKRSEIIRVGKDVERREPLCTFGRMEIGTAITENGMEVPQKI